MNVFGSFGFREFIGWWVDLPCTSYMGGVLTLWCHHEDNKHPAVRRSIKG